MLEGDCDSDGFGDETQDSELTGPNCPKADGTLMLGANKGKVEKGRKVTLLGQIDTPTTGGVSPGTDDELERNKNGPTASSIPSPPSKPTPPGTSNCARRSSSQSSTAPSSPRPIAATTRPRTRRRCGCRRRSSGLVAVVVPLWYRPLRPMCPDRPEPWTHWTIWTLADTSTPIASAGGRKVAGSNPVAPTRLRAGFRKRAQGPADCRPPGRWSGSPRVGRAPRVRQLKRARAVRASRPRRKRRFRARCRRRGRRRRATTTGGPADRQQRTDRTEAAADDPDHPAESVAGHQREARGELDHAEDDQHPTQGVEVVEYEPRVVDENVRIVKRAEAVDDVERAHDQAA